MSFEQEHRVVHQLDRGLAVDLQHGAVDEDLFVGPQRDVHGGVRPS